MAHQSERSARKKLQNTFCVIPLHSCMHERCDAWACRSGVQGPGAGGVPVRPTGRAFDRDALKFCNGFEEAQLRAACTDPQFISMLEGESTADIVGAHQSCTALGRLRPAAARASAGVWDQTLPPMQTLCTPSAVPACSHSPYITNLPLSPSIIHTQWHGGSACMPAFLICTCEDFHWGKFRWQHCNLGH